MSVFLIDRYDDETINEERDIWVFNVLAALGAAEDQLSDLDDEDLQNYLKSIGLEVWNKSNSEIDILRNNKLVAQWQTPKFILKKDNNKLYYEVHLVEWALPFQKKKSKKNNY